MALLRLFGMRVLVVPGLPEDRALVVSRIRGEDGKERLDAVLLVNIGSTPAPREPSR